jgi:hypothetical protein
VIEGDKISKRAADIDGHCVGHRILLFKVPSSRFNVFEDPGSSENVEL